MNGTIALFGTSDLQLFANQLGKELRRVSWPANVWQAGFAQYRQEIWNENSQFYRAQPAVVILQLDGADLFAEVLKDPFSVETDCRAKAIAAAAEIESYIERIRQGLPSATILLHTVYLPPLHALTGMEYHGPSTTSSLAPTLNEELGRISRKHANVLVHDTAALMAQIGYQQWFDARLWYLARSRLSTVAMKALAKSTVAFLRGWKGEARKCIVLDLDNTLWGGVVGEDGLAGIVLGEEGVGLAYAEFQEELLHLSRKGFLLALCSKNNEEEALAVFQKHPSVRLKESHFAARRINWQDKATNLRELAAELNLGLDSFIFLDDNPAERTLVRSELPEVLVPEWPSDPASFKAALLELARDHMMKVALTYEDRSRTSMYRAEGERQNLRQAAGANLDVYLRSLGMVASIGPADAFTMPRIAQLTQKTNQFNLTTRRYTQAEIQALSQDPNAIVLWLSLKDCFADNGIVGVMILRKIRENEWEIDTFLLSCRVIGRTVENALVGFACQRLRERGAQFLSGVYLPTKKNGLTATVYQDLGFEKVNEGEDETRWLLDLHRSPVPVPEWITIIASWSTQNA